MLFLQAAGLSAHALIDPTGAVILTHDTGRKAWHAKNHNSDTLGVEFLVPGAHDYASFIAEMEKPYLPGAAFVAGVELLRQWCDEFEIEDIQTHAQIDPRRKKGPGAGFPFDRMIREL